MVAAPLSNFDGEVLHEQELTLLGDGAQTVDLLGYQPYVDALVEVLAQERLQTPFAVGVFGRWGTGKSTFMNLLRDCLSLEARQERGESGGFHTVLFQPWQFEEKEEVWKALLLSVIRYLEVVQARRTTPGSAEAERVRRTLKELALSVGRLALNKTIQTMTSGVLDLDQVLDAYARTARDNSLFINTFREKFGELKKEILTEEAGDIPRLFIFVDDLDRCTPDNCIMVLEAIKLFFDLPECVFVIGIDREVVQRGIEQKYRQNLGIHGQDYIDKLIQLPFSLPPIRKETFERFVGTITSDFQFSPEIQALIVRAAEGNPRLAKRLSNCLQLTRTVARRLYMGADTSLLGDIDTLDEAKLALLLTLQVRYPVAYLWLTQYPLTLSDLETFWHEQQPGAGDREGPAEGYRARIVQFLRQAYGDRVAEQNTDGFYALWRYAHGSAINVQPFRDRQELQAYMRITGIVDEDRASDASKNQPPTAKDTLDQSYLDPDGAAEDDEAGLEHEDEETAAASRARPFGADEEDAQEVLSRRGDELRSQARGLMLAWEEFSEAGLLRAPLMLPGLLGRGERLLRDAERLTFRIDDILGGEARIGAATEIDLQDLRGELGDIDRLEVYRHVAHVSGVFVLVWPVAMAVLGTAAGFALTTLRDTVDGATAQANFLDRLIPADAGLLLESPGALDILRAVPQLFPGGPLFFWAALLYALFALGVWGRAVVKVRTLTARRSAA